MMDPDSPVGEGSLPPELPPEWQPLSAIERRIVGVLVEKAKTTPDQYPMSLNALTNGCNQKSNRSPQMNLDTDDVEEAIVRLRQLGVVAEVTGGGRVTRYRHYMKDWLGVDGTELAVMTELLLRGPQTVGQLRGRAARMSPIPDLSALHPVLQNLDSRGLVESITPEGRGQIVTHRLYHDQELDTLRRTHGSAEQVRHAPPLPVSAPLPTRAPTPTSAAPASANSPAAAVSSPPADTAAVSVSAPWPQTDAAPLHDSDAVIAELRGAITELRSEVARLHKDVEDLWANLDT